MKMTMKKVLALVLAVVMAGSLVVFAVNASPESSDAAIRFTPDRGDGVTDPDGPETPPDVDPPDEGEELDPNDPDPPEETEYLASMGLNFWSHELELVVTAARNFHSIRTRNGSWDTGRGNVDDSSVAGVEIYAIQATNGWSVTADIGPFRLLIPNPAHPETPGAPEFIPGSVQTLAGFNLHLVPHSVYENNTANATFLSTGTTPLTAAGDDVRIAEHTGTFIGGANFEARLDVLIDTAHNGRAQADMTWTFIAGAP